MSNQDVRDALAFEEQQRLATAKRPPVWLSLLAAAAYGAWFAYMWIKDDVHPLVPVGGLLLLLALLVSLAVFYRTGVRDSMRQKVDPHASRSVTWRYFAGLGFMILPSLFNPFVEGHVIPSCIAGVLCALAVFWTLHTGALNRMPR
ncbi:hypothetical protein WU87_06205 [Corynebacterium minutissimum]|uniref:Uncharacterized protein n=1 Tax=Corynebacterium minutissimum TaxID=38301 RepID=A0ACC4UBG7_9CORY|nr:hypothetical protein [Corynebacterium sp. HMSC070E08]KKO80351.1 hypothetical protein WU87_06205 [Corynebacterium minutissimum]OFN75228.1 hypothetical protein HMPREF2526_12115 [Corynebacterium sp. HMSC070E08]